MIRKFGWIMFWAACIWFLSPIYQFLAYEGLVPMILPKDIPTPTQFPQSSPFSNHEKSQSALDLLAQHRAKINAPAISAAVAIEGKIVWSGAVGWANIENEIPATDATQFRIGSTSKPVTATLLAKMVQEGKIDLDKSIETYRADLPNPDWKKLTPRQLASHTSGLPDYIDNYGDLWGFYYLFKLNKRYTSVAESLEVFDDNSLLFEPGTQYHYTSFNTVLQSVILESVAEKPFLQTMRDEIFVPLHMESTGAEYELPEKNQLASFYWNKDGKYPGFRAWQKVDLSHRLAGGGFISTPADMVKLGSAWLDNTFIKPETRRVFWHPQPQSGEESYALGWRWINYEDELGKVHNANHGGVARGSQSWLMVIPERQMVVSVMINSNVEEFWDFGRVSMPLARLFMD